MTKKKSLGAQPWLFPCPTLLVGVYGADGRPNVMTCAWAGMCCSHPPALSVAMKSTRKTMEGIRANKAFTISIPSEGMWTETDYVGLVSGHKVDKFPVAKWTPVKAETVNAPYVGEAPIVLECELHEIRDIFDYSMSIGLIKDVKVDADKLDKEGKTPDMDLIKPLIYDEAHRAYFKLGGLFKPAFVDGKRLINNA